MRKHLVAIGAAFAAGVVCWLSLELGERWRLTNYVLAGFLAVVIAAVTEIVIVLFQERDELKTGLQKVKKGLSELLEVLRERIAKDESIRYLLQYIDRDLTKVQTLETWVDLLSQLRTTYSATNYINTDAVYTNDWGGAALLIQNAKKKAFNERIVIRKVFLIENENEIAMVSGALEEQKNIGVQIHYLPFPLVKQDARLNSQLRSGEIPSVDFGIFNEDIVLVWELKDREVTHGRVLVGREHAEKHAKFFDVLFQKALDYNRGRIAVIPLQDQTREIITAWPKYRAPYEKMDGILRAPGGWLDKFRAKSTCKMYAAYDDGSLVGFSILDCTENEAEMYIALHPNQVNDKVRKLGFQLTKQMLEKGFKELELERIRVSVPRRYPQTIKFFENNGFEKNNEEGDALKMSMDKTRHKIVYASIR